jgi:hypothetical protein
LDRLADIFVAADRAEQEVLESTVLRINMALAADPSDLGESRPNNGRVWFAEPLTVGRVVVLHVAARRRR